MPKILRHHLARKEAKGTRELWEKRSKIQVQKQDNDCHGQPPYVSLTRMSLPSVSTCIFSLPQSPCGRPKAKKQAGSSPCVFPLSLSRCLSCACLFSYLELELHLVLWLHCLLFGAGNISGTSHFMELSLSLSLLQACFRFLTFVHFVSHMAWLNLAFPPKTSH